MRPNLAQAVAAVLRAREMDARETKAYRLDVLAEVVGPPCYTCAGFGKHLANDRPCDDCGATGYPSLAPSDSVAVLAATVKALEAKAAMGIDVRKGLTDCAAFLDREGQSSPRRWFGRQLAAVAEALFAVSLVETGQEAPRSEERQIDLVMSALPQGGRVDLLADRCDRLVLLVRKLARRQPSKATRAMAVRWLRENGLLSEGAKP